MTANIEMNSNEKIIINSPNGFPIDMESFTSKLKKEDDYNLRISKSFLWIYIIFIGLYGVMMVISAFDDRGLLRFLSQGFFMLSFLAFVLIFRNSYKIFKKIDYSLPLVEMLKAVVKRYQLKIGHFMLVLIPILLMDAGLTLTFYEDLLPISPLNRVLLVQAFYIPIMTISALIGILIWYKTQKPLRDRALELIEELERE